VRFKLGFLKQSSDMALANTCNYLLLDHLISEFSGCPMADGPSILLRWVTGDGIELGDLLQGEGGWGTWPRSIL
jgi:hypothetical protein